MVSEYLASIMHICQLCSASKVNDVGLKFNGCSREVLRDRAASLWPFLEFMCFPLMRPAAGFSLNLWDLQFNWSFKALTFLQMFRRKPSPTDRTPTFPPSLQWSLYNTILLILFSQQRCFLCFLHSALFFYRPRSARWGPQRQSHLYLWRGGLEKRTVGDEEGNWTACAFVHDRHGFNGLTECTRRCRKTGPEWNITALLVY